MTILLPVGYRFKENELKSINSKINVGFELIEENFYNIFKRGEGVITAFEYYDEETNGFYEDFILINGKYESVASKINKDLNLDGKNKGDYIFTFLINGTGWPLEGKQYFGKGINRIGKDIVLENDKYIIKNKKY